MKTVLESNLLHLKRLGVDTAKTQTKHLLLLLFLVAKLCPTLCATPWSVAHQVPLSMGFPQPEYGSGLPFPSLGDLANPGTKPSSPALADKFCHQGSPFKPSMVNSKTSHPFLLTPDKRPVPLHLSIFPLDQDSS